ncbi:MAG TPA: MarR family transcriptional regulator [Candidatus Limnocylindrales bacterium]|nr:MarR family transcriptional regulator [Candidatus Limnocylindrales bacterium]
MSLPELRLDNQLCFLFHRISRELDAAYRPLLAELGLTYSQYLVMLVLWEGDGLGVGELGDRLQLDSGTLSPLLRRLERAGLVRRERLASDERRVTIDLTDQGRTLRDRAAGIPAAIARCLVDDAVTYEEMHAQLISLAARLALARPAATRGDPVALGAGVVTLTRGPDR